MLKQMQLQIKKKSEQIETKNQSEALCYQTRKQLEQLEATIDAR